MNPADILRSKETIAILDKICKRKLTDENLQTECFFHIMDKLKANDYARLRQFEHKSLFSTFLHTVAGNLCTDFIRSRFGRPRFPAPIEKLGPLARRLYELICWKKFSFDDTYDLLRARGEFQGTYAHYVRETRPILEIPCKQHPGHGLVAGTREYTDTRNYADIRNRNHTQNPFQEVKNPLENLLENLDRERRIQAIHILRDFIPALPMVGRIINQADL